MYVYNVIMFFSLLNTWVISALDRRLVAAAVASEYLVCVLEC